MFAEIPCELERVQARRQRTTDLEVSDRSNPGVRTNHNRCNSDVILPEMSGRILADRMREQGKVRRVLFMEGYEDDLVARQGVLHEGVRLLQKPFLEPELLREVRFSLDT